jgi:hypothetical protein
MSLGKLIAFLKDNRNQELIPFRSYPVRERLGSSQRRGARADLVLKKPGGVEISIHEHAHD